MARAPRLALAGELHHVLLRGHNRQSVFTDDRDRQAFLAMLGEAAAQQAVAIHAYALLDAEVHLLATPLQATSLSRMMQSLGRRYVASFNRRHGRSGALWEGRFRASVIDSATLGLDAMAYVESLPVSAGLAAVAGEWPWSSAAHHLGHRRDALLTEHPAYWSLGNTPFERELAHAYKLRDGTSVSLVQRFSGAALQGRALGPPVFASRMAALAGRSLQARPRGRPRRSG